MLIDTQVLLWHVMDPERMTKRAADAVAQGHLIYSHVSVWEIAIKCGSGKLELFFDQRRVSTREFITTVVAELNLVPLHLEFDDLTAVENLPRHHHDPFDHLLIVQARRRGLPILSSDQTFDKYGIKRVW